MAPDLLDNKYLPYYAIDPASPGDTICFANELSHESDQLLPRLLATSARRRRVRARMAGPFAAPACARTLRTHPRPATQPVGAVGAGLGFAAAIWPNRAERRASVRNGR